MKIGSFGLQKIVGWSVHTLALVFLLWTTLESGSGVKKYGFDYAPIQNVFPAVFLYITLSVLGAAVLRSSLEIGYSFCIGAAFAYLVTYLGFHLHGEESFTLLWRTSLPFIVSIILLAGMGSLLLKRSEYGHWKWWLFCFLPCILLSLFLKSLLTERISISLAVMTWIWYAAFRNAQALSKRKAFRYTGLVFFAGFLSLLFFGIREYLHVRNIRNSILKVLEITIPANMSNGDMVFLKAISSSLNWAIISIIIAAISLMIFIFFEKSLFLRGRKKPDNI